MPWQHGKFYPTIRLSTIYHCYTTPLKISPAEEAVHRLAAEFDGLAFDESLHRLQLQLSEKNDNIKRSEDELQDANA